MQRIPGVPGPARVPGPAQTLLYGVATTAYLRWCHRRYGDTFSLALPGPSTTVLFAHPDDVKAVFALDADAFTAAAAAPVLEPFVGTRSLLLLDGDAHRDERHALARALAADGMAAHTRAVEDATRRDLATWPRGRPFPLEPRLRAITLEVILRRVLGTDDADHAEVRAALQPWLDRAGSLLVLAPFLRHELGGRSPWGRFVRQRAEVDRVLDALVARRRADPDPARTDVLSLLVAHDDLPGDGLRDELLTLLAAGHDTSATALAWAFDLLLHHRDELERLRAEPSYVGPVVKEVLRLRPVVDLVGRTLTRTTRIGDHDLPAGTGAAASIVLAQRHPDRYEDPDAFRPARFVDRPADPTSWLPFGGGIRRCVGAAFATAEIEAVLRTVVAEAPSLGAAGPRPERAKRRAVTLVPARGARAVLR
jgi:cytochrome P450